MSLLETGKLAFTSGEVSPDMLSRADVERSTNAASQLENWEVLVQGGVRRRDGTRYVATVKTPAKLTLLLPFEPSTTDAYVLEVGAQYLGFYKNGARIENPPGTPVEVVTPYLESELRLLRTAQSNDVLILVHPNHAPQRLSRLSDTSWVFSPVPLQPPPMHEFGYAGTVNLTLSALTGTITITAAAPVFLPADAQRQLTSGVGRAILTAITDSTHATATVLDAFTSVSVASSTWTLQGSPVAQLTVSDISPVGRQVIVDLGLPQSGATELVTNGSFGAGLANWTDKSHPQLVSSTHNGGGNVTVGVHDSTVNFVTAGVRATQTLFNVTDGCAAPIATVLEHLCLVGDPGLQGGTDNDFDTGDAYTITATGYAVAENGTAVLSGGTAGYGWIEQALTTVAGVQYEVTFRVSMASVSCMVGSLTGLSDRLAEASYPVGEHTVHFTAIGAQSFLSFRTNQDVQAGVTAISAKVFTGVGFRSSDVGSYIVAREGLIYLRTYVSGSQMFGELLKELRSADPVAAGAWTLEAPAWSSTLGYPSAVVLYEGRLGFAGTTRFPQTIWLSAIDDFFNFALGTTAADALELSLVDSGGNITLNRIRWLMPAENMLVGTTHGEYRLIGSGDDPLSPVTPPRNRIQSTFGSDTVQPLKVGAALLFAQRQGSKLREMSYDERTQTTYVARDLTVTSNHLLQTARIVQLAYQPEPTSVVWAVRSDGQLLGLTYDLSEQVVAWFRWVTDGVIESVCTIPHPTANAHQVWMTVRRTLGEAETRCVEVVDPDAPMLLRTPVTMQNDLTQESETISGWTGLTLDCATVYSGLETDTLTGLDYLEGESVALVVDGAVLPMQTVSGGEIKLPITAHETAFVGLPYVARGKTVPNNLPVRGTSAQLSRKRWVKLRARVKETACLVLHGERLPFRQPSMPMDQGPAPYSGERDIVPLGWSGQGVISFIADQPVPSTVLAIYGLLDQEAERG
jgi:hypothetical protein